jgi:pyruvate/2-oxoglutarate/acetoin dehydrogenase E1 component
MVAKEGFELLVSPIHRLGALDVPMPFGPDMENFVVPNERRIVEEVLSIVNQ